MHQIQHTEKGMESKIFSETDVEWSKWRDTATSIEPHWMLSECPPGNCVLLSIKLWKTLV